LWGEGDVRLYSVEWQDDAWTWKDLEGSSHDLTEVLPRHLPAATEKNYERFQSG
jgi:hypothetical protein